MVEGRVLAWLFGINLLRVTADVVLVPAPVQPVDGIDQERTRLLAGSGPARGTATRALSPSTGDGRPTLRDAMQLLRDTDALLERAGRSA